MGDVEAVGAAYADELAGHGSFGVVVDGEVVRLDALPAMTLAQVQRLTGVAWTDLLERPTADLFGALGLVEACEAHVGADHSGGLTTAELLARVVHVAPVLAAVPEANSGAS